MCKSCEAYNPGYLGCGELNRHTIPDGVETGECYDCDEKWRTCLKHLKKCESCNAYLCLDDDHQCMQCDVYVCRDCGFVPSIEGKSQSGNYCSKHKEGAENKFVKRVGKAIRTNDRLRKKLKTVLE
jgi:hypothetical protein